MAGHFELAWQPPFGNETAIPQSAFLLPPFTNNGLLGRYYANANWEGTPAFTQIDAGIFFYFHVIPLNRPYTVEWLGNIDIPAGGRYLFGLESMDESALWVDNQQILNDQTPGQYQEAGIELPAGVHPIRVRFSDRTGYTHIYLYWRPPQGGREIIPQSVLFPPQGDPDLLKLNRGN